MIWFPFGFWNKFYGETLVSPDACLGRTGDRLTQQCYTLVLEKMCHYWIWRLINLVLLAKSKKSDATRRDPSLER